MSLLHLLGIIANMEGSLQRPLQRPLAHASHASLLDVTRLMERLVAVVAALGHRRAEPVPADFRHASECGLDPRLLLLARLVHTTRRWHEEPLTLDTARGQDGAGASSRTTGGLRTEAVLGAVGSLFPFDQSVEWWAHVEALPRGADIDAEVLIMLVQAICWIAGRRCIQIQCPPVTLMGVYQVSLDVAVGCKSKHVTHVPGADPRLLENFCACGAREAAMATSGGAW
ncbi:hypothetical protein TOPH_00012 [Tolypocladium ophioglossoides CBS 100239]|uniref:Uncharacterized protein n=1 Tax=Tolypocladium ophioglossoides (strain CBS 100239) TaxID=1163406 RepID=A0A0L0NLM5_TOLOC|nr:hypothetical protein TOPH_00012 [Tolypocladium ophioglossoides CBS 100239]